MQISEKEARPNGSAKTLEVGERLRWPAVFLAAATLLVGCAPSRADLFNPVAQAVRERTRIAPEWRSVSRRSAATDKRVRSLLSQPLSADSVSTLAVLNSSELQVTYAELGLAGAGLTSARLARNPEVEAELTFPLSGDDSSPTLELSAVQDVAQLLAIFSRVDSADADLRAARRRATAVTVALVARARRSFYRAIAAAQRVELRRSIAEAANASAEFARRLHDAGNITDLERTRENLFEVEANIALEEGRSEMLTSREALNAVLGLEAHERHWRIAHELPPAPEEIAGASQLERDAIAASLELDALRWDLKAAGHAVGLARLQSVLPNLGVGVAAKREGEWSVGPALSLSLPLFDWGQGKRAAAWARVQALQHRYTATAINLRAAARAAAARLSNAHERAMRIRTTVMPEREKLLEQATQQYNAMNVDTFELLVMRREQVEAEERFIATLLDFWTSHSDVEQLRAGSAPAAEGGSEFGARDDRGGETASVSHREDAE